MRSRRGFTLIEVIATILVLGIISAVMLPLLQASTQTYATAADQRSSGADLDNAVARIVGIIRGITDAGALSAADEAGFELTDGTRVEFNGVALFLTTAEHEQSLLCPGIEDFELTWLGADGSELDFDAGDGVEEVRRVNLVAVSGGVVISTAACPRLAWGGGA